MIIQPGSGLHIVWNAGVDLDQLVSKGMRFKGVANDSSVSPWFALIPAGRFLMGDTFSGERTLAEMPVHSVTVSAFYMD